MKLWESKGIRLTLMKHSPMSMYWLLHKTWFHGSQILRTIWLVILLHRTCPSIKEKSSCTMWRSSFGMNHTYIGVVPTGLFDVVCRNVRCSVCWKHAIPHSLVDITAVSEPLIRYYNVVTIGQLFIKMLMSLLKHVIYANEMETFKESKSSL